MTPNIKVYSRRGVRCTPTRPFHHSDSEDETEAPKGQQHQMTYRVEDDLNWASKYLSSERGSSTPGSRRSATSPGDDVIAPSPASGKYFGCSHFEDSRIFGSRSSIGRRSKSPSTFSENSEDDFMRGAIKKQSGHYNVPLHFRIGSASPPVTHRNPITAKKGYLELHGGSVLKSKSPSISRPVTRTYEDLGMPLPGPLPMSYVASKVVRPGTRTHDDFDVSFPGARLLPDMERSRPGSIIQTDSDRRLATESSKTRRPVSETRKKLRSLLCRTKNDPRYYDDEF